MNHRIISKPTFFEGEQLLVNELFDLGLPCFHLRKPAASLAECSSFLEGIAPAFYPRIVVHQHPELIPEFGLMGWHLKEGERQKLSPLELANLINSYHQNKRTIGSSIHQKTSLKTLPPDLDYVLVSPVFPSISKQNYPPTEDWNIQKLNFPYKLIALGGIGIDTLPQAKAKGFEEVAFLGAVWEDLENVLYNYNLLCKKMTWIDLMA